MDYLRPQTVGSGPDNVLVQQHGVLTLPQAKELFGTNSVRAELRTRRWQRPHRLVVVLHNGPLTRTQRIWVAFLAAPHGSALWGHNGDRA